MKTSVACVAVVFFAGCAHYVETSSPTVTRWDDRDISELTGVIGPYDTTSVKGDWRSYDWFRFGNCHLAARTSLEGKIQKIELEGTGSGCKVYVDKLEAARAK